MLNYNPQSDEWEQQNRPETLEEDLFDNLGLAYTYRDYLLDDVVFTPQVQARLNRLDGYITGLETLLTLEG